MAQPQVSLVSGSLMASGALLIYDLLCTLDQEIEYVWSKPFAISSVLFVLNRYLPFIDTFMAIHIKLAFYTPEECVQHFKVVTWFIVIGLLISEAILMLRTYAIWERRRSVLYGFIALFVIITVPGVVLTYLELESLVYAPTEGRGCRLVHASPIIMGSYILLLLCETIIAILMFIKARQHLSRPHSRWVNRLYFRDGLLLYLYILVLSLANVIVPIVDRNLANWLATPQRVLHSIFCTRILLLIMAQRANTPRSPTMFSSIFNSDVDNNYTSDFLSSESYNGGAATTHGGVTTTYMDRVDTIELDHITVRSIDP